MQPRVKGRVMLRASIRLRALATSPVIYFISPPAHWLYFVYFMLDALPF